MCVYTSMGKKGVLTIKVGSGVFNEMKKRWGKAPDGNVYCQIAPVKGGGLRLKKHGSNLPKSIARKLSKCPTKKSHHLTNIGYLSDYNMTLEDMGGAWGQSKAPYKWHGNELRVDPPKKRKAPYSGRKGKKGKGKPVRNNVEQFKLPLPEPKPTPQQVAFNGSTPEGTGLSFSLTSSQAMELTAWLSQRGVDVAFKEAA